MRMRSFILFFTPLFLSGCRFVVLDPSGDIAAQQSDLILYATILMLVIILPVAVLTVFFALHYRESNTKSAYEPQWHQSISLEIVIWSLPLAIITCLAGLTWVATHRLDPYQPLRRISATQPVDDNVEPLLVRVVALDWKWLFLYPGYNIATLNEVAVIVDRPVEFRLTSASVMNSFSVPAMAGQIYAMPGMETELNAVMNEPGSYEGFSAHYSGAGFSKMRFTLHALDENGFDSWVRTVRSGSGILDRSSYLQMEKKSIAAPVKYFNSIEDGLWDGIVNLCATDDNSLCVNDMMMVDALGGGGLAGLFNRRIYRGICASPDSRTFYYMLNPDIRTNAGIMPDTAGSFRQEGRSQS